jgi:hypothetical protein
VDVDDRDPDVAASAGRRGAEFAAGVWIPSIPLHLQQLLSAVATSIDSSGVANSTLEKSKLNGC